MNVFSLEEGAKTLQTNGGRVCDLFGGHAERGVGMSGMSHGNASYVSDEMEVLLQKKGSGFHMPAV